jgi:hypothetical protein
VLQQQGLSIRTNIQGHSSPNPLQGGTGLFLGQLATAPQVQNNHTDALGSVPLSIGLRCSPPHPSSPCCVCFTLQPVKEPPPPSPPPEVSTIMGADSVTCLRTQSIMKPEPRTSHLAEKRTEDRGSRKGLRGYGLIVMSHRQLSPYPPPQVPSTS